MNLKGKRLLIATESGEGIAVSVAALAGELGAKVVLATSRRARTVVECGGRPIPERFEVLDLPGCRKDREAFRAELSRRWGGLDGAVDASRYAQALAPGHDASEKGVEDAKTAFRSHVYSLSALTRAVLPLMHRSSRPGGSIVGVTLASSVEWPAGDWFGGTAALEAVNRYVACELGPRGVRVNLVAAGPLAGQAAEPTPGFDRLARGVGERAPLGWDATDATPVARAVCFLLSDWARRVSGDVLHVDGGAEQAGAPASASSARR